jgi:hypothetical protein
MKQTRNGGRDTDECVDAVDDVRREPNEDPDELWAIIYPISLATILEGLLFSF